MWAHVCAWLGCVLAALGLAWQAACCFLGEKRLQRAARYNLLFALYLWAWVFGGLWAAGPRLLSRPVFSAIQYPFQDILKRRMSDNSHYFRGLAVREQFNYFGWPGKEPKPPGKGPRYVFIGDSFLEQQSAVNLAKRVEAIIRKKQAHAQVINLSKGGTAPGDYRFRFYELAFDFKPDSIVMFIYGGNDLAPYFDYPRYEPPRFGVSGRAVAWLEKNASLGGGAILRLKDLEAKGAFFNSKKELFKALEGVYLEPRQKTLIFMALYAFWPEKKQSPGLLEIPWPLWRSFFPGRLGGFARRQEFRKRYNEVFRLPLKKRLGAMARLFAWYFQKGDAITFEQKLKTLPRTFLDYWLAQVDGDCYLLPAMKKFLLNQPRIYPKINSAQIARSAQEHARFFKEMAQYAASRGVDFRVVTIPEATMVDNVAWRFWLPLYDSRKDLADKHALYRAVSGWLAGVLPCLDLAGHAKDFQDAYWFLDGHFNPRGNAAAASIVAAWLMSAIPGA